jgi:peroxiredoxin
MAIAKGTQAPAFTLNRKTAEGLETHSLADNLGKKRTVLLFFPLSFTSVCQDELCSVSSGIGEYNDLNAAVYGISVDSPFAQEAFAKAAGITVPLLSDFNKEVAAAYDVLYEELLGFKGVAKRSAFVIDTDGSVLFSWSSDDPKQLPPFEELRASLAS